MSNEVTVNDFLGSYYYKDKVHIPKLARDLVVYGEKGFRHVMEMYHLQPSELSDIMEMPVFKKVMRETRAMLEGSPSSLIAMKAHDVVEKGLTKMSDLIDDPSTKPRDVILATRLAADLAGNIIQRGGGSMDGDSGAQTSTGLIINISGGSTLSGMLPPMRDAGQPLQKIPEAQYSEVDDD